jgi:hypothetical protein
MKEARQISPEAFDLWTKTLAKAKAQISKDHPPYSG